MSTPLLTSAVESCRKKPAPAVTLLKTPVYAVPGRPFESEASDADVTLALLRGCIRSTKAGLISMNGRESDETAKLTRSGFRHLLGRMRSTWVPGAEPGPMIICLDLPKGSCSTDLNALKSSKTCLTFANLTVSNNLKHLATINWGLLLCLVSYLGGVGSVDRIRWIARREVSFP